MTPSSSRAKRGIYWATANIVHRCRDQRPLVQDDPLRLARGNSVVAVHNVDVKPHRVTLRIKNRDRTSLVNLLASDHSEDDENGVHKFGIEGHGYRWYRVGGLDYILQREKR